MSGDNAFAEMGGSDSAAFPDGDPSFGFPAELRACPQWVTWRYGEARGNGKRTKEPINPYTGRRASVSDPNHWATYAQAMEALFRYEAAGLGFVFTHNDPYCGIDLDGCRDPRSREIAPWAMEIIRALDSYTEISPSGSGVHVIVQAPLPAGGNRRGQVEMYAQGRYFTMSGDILAGTPFTVCERAQAVQAIHRRWIVGGGEILSPKIATMEKPRAPELGTPDAAVVARAKSAANGHKFAALFSGNASEYASESEATLALLNMLAYWTDGDAVQMERIFRACGLMRPKWDEMRGAERWGDQQIRKALMGSVRPRNATAAVDTLSTQGQIPRNSYAQEIPCNPYVTDPAPYVFVTELHEPASEWPPPLPPPSRQQQAALYPVEALPECLQSAAREVSRFVKAPLVSPAVVGLSIAALSIGKKAQIEERSGLMHHPALFQALIAPSGERKSPVFKAMANPLEQWIHRMEPQQGKRAASARAANAVVEKRLKVLAKQIEKPSLSPDDRDDLTRRMAQEETKRVPMPPPLRMFASDITEERLFQRMHDRGGEYAVISGEGRPIIDNIMGRYAAKNHTGDGIYLAGVSGDTITRDRVGNENGPEDLMITAPCLNVCVMVQPDKYLEAARHPALRASGALA
ncbi:DUF3987 domain-containing protein [Magnetofaba australis]|uniref:NrS-1 polymerase-like HBD domain-containing protein n=1 Tax=Magnetofaba australis IT-1 TaxID=1434232 RepID=A0A1Y2K1I9_9PROT|nr:DUF3987 domain-containing protein [Magnetofaba australis]OSM01799.1 hypothetical protein MAIT1_01837 [Magnetofaba australis IT-1]